jgi:hypothetical protein
LRAATVSVVWREAGGDRQLTADTDSTGRASFCIPMPHELQIRASYRGVQSPTARVRLAASAPHAHTALIEAPFVYVQGLVLEHATDAPVANAAVRLSHSTLSALTGPDGRFVFPHIPVGEYRLGIAHPSYAAVSAPLSARDNDLTATFRIAPEAIALPPVVVTAFSRRLDGVGFYERAQRGVGSFLDRQQIEAARVQYASDLLSRIPGVRLATPPARRGAPRSYTLGRGSCRYRFVVDGTRTLPDFELDNLSAHAIEGIEVYSGLAQIPAQFRPQIADGVGATCGVIAVWMRDGR